MEYSIQNPKNRLKLGAVLKLVTLNKVDVIDLKINHKRLWKPLSPNDFNVYAYPELRLGYNENFYDDSLELDDNNVLYFDDNPHDDNHVQLNINDFSDNIIVQENHNDDCINNFDNDDILINNDFNNIDKHHANNDNGFVNHGIEDTIIENEEYIERLHREVDKKARIEFNNGMGEARNDSELRNILSNLNNNIEKPMIDTDKLVIVEKVNKPTDDNQLLKSNFVEKEIIDSANKVTQHAENNPILRQESSNDLDLKSNNKSSNEVKFTIKLDKNEQNKYYTNVLDAIDKIFDESDDKPFKTMTDIVDEILSEDNNHNKKN